jgi:hypothetical protein
MYVSLALNLQMGSHVVGHCLLLSCGCFDALADPRWCCRAVHKYRQSQQDAAQSATQKVWPHAACNTHALTSNRPIASHQQHGCSTDAAHLYGWPW